MDSRIGLDYIVENKEYVSKLGTALDTPHNVTVKKQVFELLSALCAYSAEGYARAIETLEFLKNVKKERYRFQIVINELEKATDNEYQVAVLGFINCVIISAASLEDRNRIRNEFIGLRILPVLSNLRKVAQGVGDIVVQLDVFEEQRECDEAQSLQGPNGINLNSHLDVFYAILRQVADTPQEVPFLNILQHLLRIEPKESISDVIWDTAEKLVHRATLLENQEDSVRLLRTSSVQKFTCPHCRGDATSPSRKASAIPSTGNGPLSPAPNKTPLSPSSSSSMLPSSPPPPPPPPAPALSSLPENKSNNPSPVPPPPPPPLIGNGPLVPPPPPPVPPPPALFNSNGLVPPPPAPINLFASIGQSPYRNISTEFSSLPDLNTVRLPQQEIPAPKSKMKTLNWGKIPPNKVIGKQNIWSIVASEHQHSPMADIDWNEMEGLFCLQSNGTQGSPKLGGRAGSYDTTDRKTKKETTEITLLDGKRSLNVNIFLKQFRSSNEAIMDLIRKGEHSEFGAEKLRGLLKLLPEVDELDLLKSFNGDKTRLGNAENFLLQLLEVSNYKLRIESMLLKAEFGANIQYLDPCINAMIFAGEDLINNKMLQEVLYVVLVAGNFLNSGGYAGNAAGVKLSSLQKLTDIRANKPGMNLIHFVAMQVAKRNPELLSFPSQLTALESATKTSSEQITNEINTLDSRIRVIKQQVELPTTDNDIKQQMQEFLLNAEREVLVLKNGMKEVESMRLKLSEFFCEDPAGFKLEECYKIFFTFCEKFKRAVTENDRRREQEAQATLRRKQREEQLAKKTKQAGTPSSDIENSFPLDGTFDPRASPALSRRRMGSMNNGIDQSNNFIRNECNDGMSPDITPNGSLRRRRSRVLAEEDELMEYLRSSIGHDHISRERKAYGSLDRSWARRNRSSSSSRKRPDILNLDFGNERERASSPGPLVNQDKASPITPQSGGDPATPQSSHEDVKPRISRDWRQKIETWLKSNENDEKQNEEYKRKRRLVNSSRRSLENDNENERKLHTLEEEKTLPISAAATINHSSSLPATNETKTTATSTNGTNKTQNNIDSYKRVYPDWKPSKTLEQTDIVGTLQAIAEVTNPNEQHQYHKQTQSHTRGHNNNSINQNNNNNIHNNNNININNNNNNNDNSKTSLNMQSGQLHSITEEDRRRSFLHELAERDPNERIQIYITRPRASEEKDINDLKNNSNSNNDIPKSLTPSNSGSNFAMNSNKNMSIAPLTKTASYTKVTQQDSSNSTKVSSSTPTTATISTNNFNTLSNSKSVSNINLSNDKTNSKPNINPNPNSNSSSSSNLKMNAISGSKSSSSIHSKPNAASDDTFATLLDHHKSHNEQYSRKEIDADNIETPPVSRRMLTSPTSTLIKVNISNNESQHKDDKVINDEEDDLQQGHIIPGTFDRHSLARRTRRYKRNNDGSSGNEDGTNSSSSHTISKDLSKTQSPAMGQNSRKSFTNLKSNHNNNNNPSLTNQNDLKNNTTSSSSTSTSTSTSSKGKALQRVGKLGHQISSINQEDVREAIRNLKSPTGTPDRIWSPPRDVILQPTKENFSILNGLIGTTTVANKLSTHDLNDEGFEETQSLVSDSASAHGKGESTTSSCNEGLESSTVAKHLNNSNDNKQALNSNVSISRTPRSNLKAQPTNLRSKSQAPHISGLSHLTAAERRSTSTTRPLPRSSKETQSFRHANSTASLALLNHHSSNNNNSNSSNNNAMKRSESVRKVGEKSLKSGNPSLPNNVKRNMDLTSSRNSLSSRSSINSGASTNTVVRRTPLLVTKPPADPVSSSSSTPSKKPLTMQNSRIKSTVPASRSSSSSSSVGPNIIVIRHHQQQHPSPNLPTRPSSQQKSFNNSIPNYSNENQSIQNKKPRSNPNRSATLVKAAIANIGKNGKPETIISSSNSSSLTNNDQRPKVHSAANKGLSSFMRPTASSATKRNKV